jgi:prevent-host-death family protein
MLDAVNLAWKLAAVIGGWVPAGLLETYHSERHFAGTRALLQTQAQVALRRGQDPAGEALRELFLELLADEQPLRRLGALIAGTSIRYPAPGPGQHTLTGTFAPDLTLHADQGATSVADLMHTARPVLLDLADRRDLRETARDWQHRVDIHTAKTGQRPADALLIRPDARIAWAAATDEPAGTAAPALREALSRWFGTPESQSTCYYLSRLSRLKVSMNWQIQEAKQRFSELIRVAQSDGPQIVTRHGQEIAVVIDIAEYRHLKGETAEFKDYLRSGPGFDELELERSAERPRNIDVAHEA